MSGTTFPGLGNLMSGVRASVSDVDFAAAITDDIIEMTTLTAPRIVTIPSGIGWPGKLVIVGDASGKAASFPITIQVAGGGTINGLSSVSIGRNNGRLFLWSDGANWRVLVADVNLDSALRYLATSDKTVTNTTADTSLFPTTFIGNGLTLPTGFWSVGRTLRIKGEGIYTTPLASQVTIKVKLGGVTLATVTTDAFADAMTNADWSFELQITCRSTGASGQFKANGLLLYDISGANPANSNLHSDNSTVPTVNTTAATALDVTAAWDVANTNRSATVMQATVEVLA